MKTFLYLLISSGGLVSAQADTSVTFSKPEKFELPGQKIVEAVTFGDFDGNGKLDAISGNYPGNLIIRKNTGDGKFKFGQPEPLKINEQIIKLRHW